MAAHKLRQDGYGGARPLAGKRLAAALAERTGFDGDGSNYYPILPVIIRLVYFLLVLRTFGLYLLDLNLLNS